MKTQQGSVLLSGLFLQKALSSAPDRWPLLLYSKQLTFHPAVVFCLLNTLFSALPGEKPFECRLCGQRSRDYSAMIKHLRTHNGASPYRCTVCLEFCSSLVSMQKHIKSHAVQDFPPGWNISNTYLYNSHTWTKPRLSSLYTFSQSSILKD